MESHQFSSLTNPVVESHGGHWQGATWLCPTVHRPTGWGISHRNEISCLHDTTGGRIGPSTMAGSGFCSEFCRTHADWQGHRQSSPRTFFADAVLNAELYRARVATKCKTYRSVQTDYASVWCKNSGMLIISTILRLVLRQIMISLLVLHKVCSKLSNEVLHDHLWNTLAKTKQPGNLITS